MKFGKFHATTTTREIPGTVLQLQNYTNLLRERQASDSQGVDSWFHWPSPGASMARVSERSPRIPYSVLRVPDLQHGKHRVHGREDAGVRRESGRQARQQDQGTRHRSRRPWHRRRRRWGHQFYLTEEFSSFILQLVSQCCPALSMREEEI